MVKAIIFDAYGTLISTGNGSVSAAEEILALNRRYDIDPKEFYARWKAFHKMHMDSLESFVKEDKIFEIDLRELYEIYHISGDYKKDVHIMLDTLGKRTAFPEAREVLEQLSLKCIIAIGSTTDTAPLLSDIKRNNLKIEKVFTSESLRVYKPRKEFYDKILEELKVSANEALFVGDSLIDDVAGPQKAGLLTCWINRKGGMEGDICPNYEIKDLRELFDIIK